MTDQAQHLSLVDEEKDYFVEKDGLRYAGAHILVDLWGAENLTDKQYIDQMLQRAAEVAGATVLDSNLHQFSSSGGVSGVLLLAESHISIHTWPEREFAAIDIFMCGRCDPYRSVVVLKEAFKPDAIQVNEQKRGLLP
ncbi:MAG: adenosylmethionine decarboxylase [Rhodospirillales bacterium]|jgi:S-adenosylmethionine decarboxylase